MRMQFLCLAMCLFAAHFAQADTHVDGLSSDAFHQYDLSLELSGNDSHSTIIGVWPVNVLSIRRADRASGRAEEVLKTKITNQEYIDIYQRAIQAISEFRVLEQPHGIGDATHYRLSLKVNGREISIRYDSIDDMRSTSANYGAILDIVNRYMPGDKGF